MPSLSRHPDFLKLWGGQTISAFGSLITREALPLTAALTLHASPAQMGMLSAASLAPALLAGLFIGVWVDRHRRRPILLWADVGRAVLLLSIPAAAFADRLTFAQLYMVAALTGLLGVLFNVAYHAYLPSLIAPNQLVEGNSKLSATEALAEIVMPGVTGLLVQVITAPLTLFFDALSFVVSALSLAWLRAQESPPPRPATQPHLGSDLTSGLRLIAAHSILRVLVLGSGLRDFFGGFYAALYALYALRVVGFTPFTLGVVVGAGGLGALAGAVLAAPALRRLGSGRAIAAALLLGSLFGLLTPLAGAVSVWVAFAFMMTSQIVGDAFRAIYEINALSLKQRLAPIEQLGRVNASGGIVTGGLGMLGVLTGGVLGEAIGIWAALWVAALGSVLVGVGVWFTPLRERAD